VADTISESSEFLEQPPKFNEFRRIIRVMFGRPVVTAGFVILVITRVPKKSPFENYRK
jgi:hypothetical protein